MSRICFEERFAEVAAQEVPVHVLEWRAGSGQDVLATEGLGPCTGVAIHDKQNRIGYMGHFVDALTDQFDIAEMLEAAISTAGSAANLRVWVRGAVPLEHEVNDFAHSRTRSGRAFIESLIEKHGIEVTDIEWLSDPNCAVAMALDCATGRCEIVVSPDTFGFEYV